MDACIVALENVAKFLEKVAPGIEESGVRVYIERSQISHTEVTAEFFDDDGRISCLYIGVESRNEGALLITESDWFTRALADAAITLFWNTFDFEDSREALREALCAKWGLVPGGKYLAALY